MELPLESLGRYRIVRFLARGGMGELYVAIDPARPEREVVLKCVRAPRRLDQLRGPIRMFLDEARVATLIEHDNVVRVDAVDYESGIYYLVMEKLEGWDLGTVMTHMGRANELIPLPLVARLVIEACHGLHAAHECVTERGDAVELVHRDVSPPNLFVTTAGTLKVLDFGVAKTAIQTAETQVGHLKGKASYMSPEQARGQRLDRRSDIFSLGIVLHELLTGQRLFSRARPHEALQAVLDELIPPPSRRDGSLSEALQGVTMRALQRDRDLRFRSANEFATAIKRVVPESTATEGEEIAALVADVRPRERSPTSTVSIAHSSEAVLERWAEEFTEQISQTAPGPRRKTLQTWAATQMLRTRRLSSHLRTPLGLAVAATILLGCAVGLGVGIALLRPRSAPVPGTVATGTAPRHVPPSQPRPTEPAETLPTPTLGAPADPLPAPELGPPTRTRAPRRTSRPETHERRPKAESKRSPEGNGRLTLEATPWANVYLGDKLLGATPLVERKLPSGRVTLRLVNPETGQRQRVTLEIPPGGILRHNVTLD